MTFGQVRGVWVGPERSGITLWCLMYSAYCDAQITSSETGLVTHTPSIAWNM